MRFSIILSAALVACASAQQPACPQCYEIDEVAPYEPPRRMIILCDQPDASAPEPEPEYPPPDSGEPFARVF